MAKIWSHLPERAKAIVLPPAPAKVSIRIRFWAGAEAARCVAILLGCHVSWRNGVDDECVYENKGSDGQEERRLLYTLDRDKVR